MSRSLERIIHLDQQIREGLYPNADTLAVHWEVSRRVIFSDRKFLLERLRAPLAYNRVRGGWYYSEPNWALPSCMVTQGELLAFFLSVEIAQSNAGDALGTSLRSAVAKIARLLPDSVEVRLDQLRAHYSFAAPSNLGAKSTVLLALHEAIAAQRIVEIVYFTASTGQRKTRTVHPHHLHHAHGDWYLVAFDIGRQKMLSFHVGRIEQHHIGAVTFARQPDFDGEEWVRASFVTESSGAPQNIAIRFDEYQARYIRERRFHQTQTLEEQSDGGVILRFESSGLGEIQRWVLGYGAHAEVLSPPELRHNVQAEIEKMRAIYKETL